MAVAWGRPNLKKMFIKLIQPIVNWWFRRYPREMVSWWKKKDKVRAKLVRTEQGDYRMLLEGEKYLQPNYPRGHILFGRMSKLKHVIKNEIFNRSWDSLERDYPKESIVSKIKGEILPAIFKIMEESRYDMLPFKSLSQSMKELWRAWTVVEGQLPEPRRTRAQLLKELVVFILQEDDAYRFRFQWMCGFFNPNSWWRFLTSWKWYQGLDYALGLMEHAEIIGDMKERQRLFRRVILMVLEDPETRESFEMLIKELDWNKLKLSKADKYFFRGKYFKVDYPFYSY